MWHKKAIKWTSFLASVFFFWSFHVSHIHANSFQSITEGKANQGLFGDLDKKVRLQGGSLFEVFLSIGIIVLVVAWLIACVKLKHYEERNASKEKLLRIFIAALILCSIGYIVSLIYGISTGFTI